MSIFKRANIIEAILARPDAELIVDEAKDWIRDCDFEESKEDPDFVDKLSPVIILKGVNKHFGGGLKAFLYNYENAS